MKQNPEHELQKAAITWFNFQYPQYHLCLFAIPNAGKRSPRGGKWMKEEGLTAGVSDLFLAIPVKGYCGLFIEMKIRPNKPTDSQIEFQQAMRKRGYDTSVCYSIDEFIILINYYLSFVKL